jgi:hypothetical protein
MRSLDQPPQDAFKLLARAGFRVLAETESEGFGDRLVVLGRGAVLARLVRERGQWFLEVASGTPGDEWFDMDLWLACLDHTPVPKEPSPLIDQAAALIGRLPDIESALLPEGAVATGECLRVVGLERARSRIGLDPAQ